MVRVGTLLKNLPENLLMKCAFNNHLNKYRYQLINIPSNCIIIINS